MTASQDDARLQECRLGAGVLALRIVSDALLTIALASAATFLLALLPLVGVVDERAFTFVSRDALDDWAQAWLGVAIAVGFLGVGLLAVAFRGAADASARARLRRVAELPGADRLVPVREQRAILQRRARGISGEGGARPAAPRATDSVRSCRPRPDRVGPAGAQHSRGVVG